MDASGTPTWRAWCSACGQDELDGGRCGVLPSAGRISESMRAPGGGQTDEMRGAADERNGRSARRSGQRTLILFSGEPSQRRATAAVLLSVFQHSLLSLSPSSISAFLCCQIYLSKCAAATFMLTAGDLNWMLGALRRSRSQAHQL
jgi:hypothetical protein